ncbi:MAG: insulinase family protein [Deltaproteobacteria bacterium]|nr:insulinase family protein [Deltaproteobacteria bacterium]
MRCRRGSAYDRLLLAVWLACAAVQDVHTHHLDNGLTLHIAPGHPSPVVAVQAWVGVGSADEQPHEAGIAHAVEHMLFKGSTGYGLGELARAIEAGGGEINAFTAYDHTVYHAVLGRDHADSAIDALGDTLLSPRVDPAELAREREVILEEIRQGSDDPARSVAQSLFATAFATHPYRRPVIGTADSVRDLAERQLVEFFRGHYVADNLTLVVAGDVDPARIKRAVERRFRAMPAQGVRRVPRGSEPEQTAPRASAQYRDVSEAYLAVGFHVPSARHPDVAALDVAAILLGQSESARLPRLLRDRDQLVSSAYANVHALRDPGLIVLSATTSAARATAAIGELVDQSLALVDHLDSDELEVARIAAESSFVRQLETAQGRARSLGWHATVAGDPQFGHVYLDRIRSVRRHDVTQVMQRYLQPHNASVAAILPKPARASAKGRAQVTREAASRVSFAREAERRVRRSLTTKPVSVAPAEKRVVLGNGTVLLVRRDPSVPVVAMRAVWRGGQRAEDPARAGASTLLARMITRGCGKLSAAQIADKVDRLGGALSGVAGRNSFGVAGEFLARSWKSAFELLADCVLVPALTSAELEHQRRLLLDDQIAQADDPTQIAFRTFSEALYGTHPYARDVLGTPASIGALDRDSLRAFYRERYPTSALTLSIVGDVDLDEVINAAKARFDGAPRSTAKRAVEPAPFAERLAALDQRKLDQREVYRFLDRAQAHLVVGYPGATLDAPDRFALELLVSILGGQGGRLFAELRDKRALVYRVSAHSIEGVDPGFVAVYLSCAPDKLGEAVATVRAELSRIRTAGVTAAELDRAKSYAIGSHQIAMQRRSAIANAMAYHEAYGLGWESWSRYGDAIRTVKPADIAAAAAKYLRDDRMITATVRSPIATPGALQRSKIKQPPRAPVKSPPARRPPARVRPRGNA